MADLKVEEGALSGASSAIGGIATDFESVAQSAERAVGNAHSAVTHPGLLGALETVLGHAQTAHRTVHAGLSSLGTFASSSSATYAESDADLAARLREA